MEPRFLAALCKQIVTCKFQQLSVESIPGYEASFRRLKLLVREIAAHVQLEEHDDAARRMEAQIIYLLVFGAYLQHGPLRGRLQMAATYPQDALAIWEGAARYFGASVFSATAAFLADDNEHYAKLTIATGLCKVPRSSLPALLYSIGRQNPHSQGLVFLCERPVVNWAYTTKRNETFDISDLEITDVIDVPQIIQETCSAPANQS